MGQVYWLKSDNLKAVISDWKMENRAELHGCQEKQVGWESFLARKSHS